MVAKTRHPNPINFQNEIQKVYQNLKEVHQSYFPSQKIFEDLNFYHCLDLNNFILQKTLSYFVGNLCH